MSLNRQERTHAFRAEVESTRNRQITVSCWPQIGTVSWHHSEHDSDVRWKSVKWLWRPITTSSVC